MTLQLYYSEPSTGNLILAAGDTVRLATLELNMQATECAVGTSKIIVDDPAGTFYVPGHRPLYLIETEAVTDDFQGIIGVFWTWNRTMHRGPYRTGAGREVVITCKDLNTLLTMRVQKGTDAERDSESDVQRMQWLINTAEVIGGFGDNGFSIEETEFFFTDNAVTMSETDYTGNDSAGVINDALQDSSKTAWLYNRPEPGDPIRVGIWYGHTERADFTSDHSISNDLSDVDIDPAVAAATQSAATLLAGNWTFAPSMDAELDRDPSRQITGALVQWDGGSTYVSQTDPEPSLTRRDMTFQAELVKNEAQATRRGNSYLDRLETEDDAITCSVLVPPALVNGFHQGMRVPVRFTHLSPEGYAAEPVNMRIAQRTVRQTEGGLYEIALDLRGESRPFTAPTPPGEEPPVYSSSIFARLSKVSGPYPNPTGDLHWDDVPQLPWETTSAMFEYVTTGKTGHRWSGIQVTQAGTIQSIVMVASAIGVALGANDPYTVTFELCKNGTAIESWSQVVTVDGASNAWSARPRLEARDVSVSASDVISGRLSCIGANGQAMEMFRSPIGVDPGVLLIRGGSF